MRLGTTKSAADALSWVRRLICEPCVNHGRGRATMSSFKCQQVGQSLRPVWRPSAPVANPIHRNARYVQIDHGRGRTSPKGSKAGQRRGHVAAPCRRAKCRWLHRVSHGLRGFHRRGRHPLQERRHRSGHVARGRAPLLDDTIMDYVEIDEGNPHFIFLNPKDPTTSRRATTDPWNSPAKTASASMCCSPPSRRRSASTSPG
jgi:hypothetical protein